MKSAFAVFDSDCSGSLSFQAAAHAAHAAPCGSCMAHERRETVVRDSCIRSSEPPAEFTAMMDRRGLPEICGIVTRKDDGALQDTLLRSGCGPAGNSNLVSRLHVTEWIRGGGKGKGWTRVGTRADCILVACLP